MKTAIKIIVIIITIALLALWAFDILDNEKLLWAITVAVPAVIALWKNNQINVLKKDIDFLSSQNKIFVDENIRLRKTK